MKIIVFGGTTEGRLLAKDLSSLSIECMVCVATEAGAEEICDIPGINVHIGRLDVPEMTELCRQYDLIVDAAHPYAEILHRNILKVSTELSLTCFRVIRPETVHETVPGPILKTVSETAIDGIDGFQNIDIDIGRGRGIHPVSSLKEAADFIAKLFLSGQEGNVLLTTGSKGLFEFSIPNIDKSRLFARVLPVPSALKACKDIGLKSRQILAIEGPFSEDLNRAIFKQYNIKWLVTKDSGREGGMPEKLAAAEKEGVSVILLKRPAPEKLAASSDSPDLFNLANSSVSLGLADSLASSVLLSLADSLASSDLLSLASSVNSGKTHIDHIIYGDLSSICEKIRRLQ